MSTKERMSAHQILSELKVLDSRIRTAINETSFVLANKHSNEKINGVPIKEVVENMKSMRQKANDFIKRKNAMKRALDSSNAVTKVTIAGTEYTVVEAIYMKNHGIEHLQYMLTQMRVQWNYAQNKISENSGDVLEKRAENYILSVIQAQPKDSKMSVDGDAMKALRKTYIENNTYDLIDPSNILKEIESLSDYIAEFASEVDAALSVSNAITMIEFEY